MKLSRCGGLLVAVGLLAACGSAPAPAAGDSLPTPPPVESPNDTSVDANPPVTESVVTEAPPSTPKPAATAPDSTARPIELIAEYGPKEGGFVIVGAPAGLRVTEVPTQETIGPIGESTVSQRFTAATLDSQVNVGRTTDIDTARLMEEFKAAERETGSETSSVVIGHERSPGYFFREEGLGWRGVTWFPPDDSVMWVLASGLTDDEIIEVAENVEVR